jgi:hypothetical protein
MADEITGVTIPELPEGGTLTGAEQFEMVQDGVSRRTTADEIKTLAGAVTDIQSDTLDVSIADGVATMNLPYKSYVALLNQTGTDAPVATVLENNTGQTFTFSYDSSGVYFINGAFDVSKTFVQFSSTSQGQLQVLSYYIEPTFIQLFSFVEAGGFILSDDSLINTPIEIRIYP